MLYRRNNDQKRIHVLCYDIVRMAVLKDNILLPLINVALIWRDILKLGDGVVPGKTKIIFFPSFFSTFTHVILLINFFFFFARWYANGN